MSDTWGKGSVNNNIGWGQAAGSATNDWGKSQKNSYAGQTDIVGITSVSIAYSANNYCDDSGNTPQPTVSNNTGSGTFSSTSGLIIDTNTGVINTDTSTAGSYVITYTDTDAATATFSLAINDLDNAAFSYSASSFEPTGADPTPTITGLTGGTFSGTTGLVINSTTGEIDLSASTEAPHTVTYNTSTSGSSVCPNTSTFAVTIAVAGISNVYSMNFDASSSDYIDAGNPTELQFGDEDFSITSWFKMSTSQSNNLVGKFESSGNQRSYAIWIDESGSGFAKFVISNNGQSGSGNTTVVTDNNSLSLNNWHFVAVVYDSTNNLAKISVDGNSFVTASHSGGAYLSSTANFRISNINVQFFNGSIDEVGVWDTALTSTQVQSIYNATSNNLTKDLSTIEPSNLKYWNRLGD